MYDNEQYIILIIDHQHTDRDAFNRFLAEDTKHNYQVLEALTAEEGVAMCQEHQPDCIVLSTMLPDMGGIEALDSIRRVQQMVAVVVTSNEGSESVAVEFMKRGVQDYLSKVSISGDSFCRSVVNAVDRVRLHTKILTADEKLKTVLATVVDGIVVLDAAGEIQTVNPAIERIFGYVQDDIVGQHFSLLLADNYSRSNDDIVDVVLQKNKTHPGTLEQLTAKHKSGRSFSIEIGISEMQVGSEVMFVGSLRDVTVQKENQRILKEAKERADEANAAKSEFLATMSHEIRTPMNGVIGMTELLGYTDLNEKQQRYVDTIQASGELLLVLINDILDFSKIDAGELVLEEIDFSMRDVVIDTIRLLTPRAREHKVELALRCKENIPNTIVGDPARLKQILTNLVGNAIKFSTDGHVVVSIDTVRDDNGNVRLTFDVQDDGVGIPQEKLKTIFNQFAQVDASTTRKYGGTGLGLTIAKRLVEMMGGQIGVTSQEGQGSTFSFYLPLDMKNATFLDPISLPEHIRNSRVLVIDDYVINKQILAEYFSELGLSITHAANKDEAVGMLRSANERSQPYDIVFMDSDIPNIDVCEFAKQMTENKELFATYKVVITSIEGVEAADSGRNNCEIDMIDGWLVRPFYKSLLVEVLKQLGKKEKVASVS